MLVADDGALISVVYNEASRTEALAPGCVLLIYSPAFQTGPQEVTEAAGFPLVTDLAGTSIRVTVDR